MTKEDKELLECAAAYISNDFKRFCDYIEEKKVKVSRRDLCMKEKDCFTLDGMMHFQEKYPEQLLPQKYYAVIQFFSFFSQRFGIWNLKEHSKTLLKHEKGRYYDLFWQMSDRARYLLFWACFVYEYAGAVKMDIPTEGGGTHAILGFFAKEKPGTVIKNTPDVRSLFFEDWQGYAPVMRIFHELGLCQVETYESGHLRNIASIEIAAAGCAAGRWFQKCDMQIKRQMQEEYYDPWEYIEQVVPVYGKQFASEDRFLLQEFFTVEVKKCVYDLKISLGECIRTFRINGSHTLEELHLMIQSTFRFDNDHLYYFSIGHGMMQSMIYSPYVADSAFTADEVTLDDLQLEKGECFTYLFDFGDEWQFRIQVEKMAEGSVDMEGVIYSRNDPPAQYGGWDEYGEEDLFMGKAKNYDQLLEEYFKAYPNQKIIHERYYGQDSSINKMLSALKKFLTDNERYEQLDMGLDAEEEKCDDGTFWVCRDVVPWREMLEFHRKADLLHMSDIAGVECKQKWTKDKITEVLAWRLADTELLTEKFLDQEARETLLYIYDLDGDNTEREFSFPALANLLMLGLISIHWPRPEWAGKVGPAIIWSEEAKEDLYEGLKEVEGGQLGEEWAEMLEKWKIKCIGR